MSTRRQLVASFLAFPVAGVSMQAQAQGATQNGTITKGIAYAERDGTPLLLDAYLSTSGDPPCPAALLFHGAGWFPCRAPGRA